MADKYFLDKDGLSHLWEKIKSTFVKQESGKGLSTNDYTTTEKNKLSGIDAGAQVNQNAFGSVSANGATIKAATASDTLPLQNGDNVTITIDEDKGLLAISAKDTVYTHPTYTAKTSGLYKVTVDGTGHVSDATAVTKTDITGLGIPASNTTYSDFTGATSSAAGAHGLVPAPAAGDQNKVLVGGKAWKEVGLSTQQEEYGIILTQTLGGTSVGSNTELFVASSTAHGLMDLADKKKLDAFGEASTYALKTDITNVYKYKGSVATSAKLPTSGQTAGDVYNIEASSTYGPAGTNVAWTGSAWDALGGLFEVTAITNTEIDTICV
jgi:hypothetical protein